MGLYSEGLIQIIGRIFASEIWGGGLFFGGFIYLFIYLFVFFKGGGGGVYYRNFCKAKHLNWLVGKRNISLFSKWFEPRSISSSCSVIVRVSVVLKRTVGDSD